MKAIVLAGGYATRLRPISYVIPKLLFPVVGKPMIYWTLDLLQRFSVDDVVLGVNYLAEPLRAEVGKRYGGMRIEYSLEDLPLGTAGPIRLACQKIAPEGTFLAMNGDVLADIDLAKMQQHHEKTTATITDALHEVSDPHRFGVVELDSNGLIRRFVEKPQPRETRSHLVNAGIYLIEPQVLRMIPPKRKVSLEREIFPRLTEKGKLGGFPFSGFWFDIGSLTDYRTANFDLLRRYYRRRGKRHVNATIKPPYFLGKASKIEDGASVGPHAIIGKNGLIGRKAHVSESILFDDVTVGEGSIVLGAIVASNVTIGKHSKIDPGSVISPNVQIGDNIRIGTNAIIHPFKEITGNVRLGGHVM